MPAGATDIDSVKAAIQAVNQQWETNFKNRDAAGLAALFSEKGVRMPQGGPTTIGQPAHEAAYRQEFADLWQTQCDVVIQTDEVMVAGEYAFARGTDTLTQHENGKIVQYTGKWMATYRQEADGVWKYLWSMYNSNEPG